MNLQKIKIGFLLLIIVVIGISINLFSLISYAETSIRIISANATSVIK